jgi:hypothetical protein
MQALKVLVIGLGVAIVVAFSLLVYGLSQQFGGAAGDEGFGTVELALPAGARIADTRIDADRVLVRVALPDGSEQLHVVDIESGRALGRIDLKPAP